MYTINQRFSCSFQKFSHISSEERRKYAAMVASLDESVGSITKALKTKGMFDNSVIVFTTDNGGAPAGFDWSQGSNYPFKGGKDTLWEGGVRGVAFVHSAMIAKKGRVSYDLMDATDWLPTFYHLAGGDVTKIQDKIDGMNVWDTIAQGAQSPRSEVLHNIDPIRKFAAIRVDQYKLVVNQDAVFRTTWHPRYEVRGEPGATAQADTLPGAIVDCGLGYTYQTVDCDTDKFPCLFDISKDPCEYQNIAHTNLPVVRKLLYRIFEYQRRALPVWYPQRDPLADPALHGGSWGPWESISADNTKTINEEKIPAVMSTT
ncbi:arylsulfatase I-like [Oculina patagonica]